MGGGAPAGVASMSPGRGESPESPLRALPGGAVMRPAKAADQAAIRRLIRMAGINPLGLDWRRFVVVEAQGDVFACGQVRAHGDGSRELASLAVAQDWQGKGVGRAIIEHLQRQAGPPLWLTCREGLIPLYQRFGFRAVTDASDLSPYFQRLMRVARLVFRIVRPKEGLAVMHWPESCTDDGARPVAAWREGQARRAVRRM